jgi:hypothetical protein
MNKEIKWSVVVALQSVRKVKGKLTLITTHQDEDFENMSDRFGADSLEEAYKEAVANAENEDSYEGRAFMHMLDCRTSDSFMGFPADTQILRQVIDENGKSEDTIYKYVGKDSLDWKTNSTTTIKDWEVER